MEKLIRRNLQVLSAMFLGMSKGTIASWVEAPVNVPVNILISNMYPRYVAEDLAFWCGHIGYFDLMVMNTAALRSIKEVVNLLYTHDPVKYHANFKGFANTMIDLALSEGGGWKGVKYAIDTMKTYKKYVTDRRPFDYEGVEGFAKLFEVPLH